MSAGQKRDHAARLANARRDYEHAVEHVGSCRLTVARAQSNLERALVTERETRRALREIEVEPALERLPVRLCAYLRTATSFALNDERSVDLARRRMLERRQLGGWRPHTYYALTPLGRDVRDLLNRRAAANP